MSGRLAEIIMVAGPNGAGKTSFARTFLTSRERQYEFFNADEIARVHVSSGLTRGQADFRAGREIIGLVEGAVALGLDMVIETTLAGKNWARAIPDWRERGYANNIVLFGVARCRQGGGAGAATRCERRTRYPGT